LLEEGPFACINEVHHSIVEDDCIDVEEKNNEGVKNNIWLMIVIPSMEPYTYGQIMRRSSGITVNWKAKRNRE